MNKIVKVPEWIMDDIRENMYLEAGDTSRDKEILQMEGVEFFDKWLEWNGICGYTTEIIKAIYYAFGIDLELYPVFTRMKDE